MPPDYVCSWNYLYSDLLTENELQTKRCKELQIGELIERQKTFLPFTELQLASAPMILINWRSFWFRRLELILI